MIKIMGVMTGTSCDGLDACCIEAAPSHWRPLWSKSVGYPTDLRNHVLEIQKPGHRGNIRDLLALDRDLGSWLAHSISKIIEATPSHQKPDVIAMHGQTIAHFPLDHTTLQIGDPARVAFQSKRTVISHFRNGDLAAGGQGAPLAPFFHRTLLKAHFGKKTEGLAIHNLGGMSNLTYLGPHSTTLSWDTGPANLWIDAATQWVTRGKFLFDKNGSLAKDFHPDLSSVKKILSLPYFRKKPPKSTGRDDFPFELLLKNTPNRDGRLIATATQITAESIANDYQKWILRQDLPLDQIFFCGGGAFNSTLISKISKLLPGTKISNTLELGVPPQQMEAQAFAMLGVASLVGLPLGGSWTGAKNHSGVPGQITPGQNWSALSKKIALLNQRLPKYL